MTTTERDAKIKALQPALRRLYREFAEPSAALWRAMYDHGCGESCSSSAGMSRPFCPVNQLMSKAWHPLQLMADSLEWFLLDGEMPGLYADAYVKGDARLEAIT